MIAGAWGQAFNAAGMIEGVGEQPA